MTLSWLLSQRSSRGWELGPRTLEGEAGIGKTTLWREALQRAGARGAQVLVTRSGESEAFVSFAALGDVFGAVDEGTIGRLPIPQREAISAAALCVRAQCPATACPAPT